ncbi:DUF1178 family protein [soil metagenome]
MIVFDLKCARAGHVFEGWFGSTEDFDGQCARGLVACPMCGDTAIAKAVMAPAVGAKSNQAASLPVPVSNSPDATQAHALMVKLAQAQSEALAQSEWVGRQFADTARAMHYGEQAHKSVHGEVAPEEARALIEEGVEVAPLLFPVVPPKAQN